ncbi:hypothetical protein OFP26_31855, partial [Escherichia coli]|nr:hypothetical protein [Escherichia coli]
MDFIKFILILLGLIFGAMFFLWLFGLITSLLWYGFWIGLLAAVGYGGFRLFRRAEDRFVGHGSVYGEIDERDFSLTWDEYEK